jgi:hypothetical protein
VKGHTGGLLNPSVPSKYACYVDNLCLEHKMNPRGATPICKERRQFSFINSSVRHAQDSLQARAECLTPLL